MRNFTHKKDKNQIFISAIEPYNGSGPHLRSPLLKVALLKGLPYAVDPHHASTVVVAPAGRLSFYFRTIASDRVSKPLSEVQLKASGGGVRLLKNPR